MHFSTSGLFLPQVRAHMYQAEVCPHGPFRNHPRDSSLVYMH